MLDEYRQLYTVQADLIPNWKNIDRNELCRQYVRLQSNEKLQNAYISAIVISFWHILVKTYNKQMVKVLTPEECYECLIDSILGVLKAVPWDDPKQSIYQDEKGPEKAINITFQQNIINLFVASKRHKRRLSNEALSLDSILKTSDGTEYSLFSFISDDADNMFNQLFWKDMVTAYFRKKEYITAFALDLLLTTPSLIKFENNIYRINVNSLFKVLTSKLDESYCSTFSEIYGVDVKQVDSAFQSIYNLDKPKLQHYVTSLSNDIRLERGMFFDFK